MVNYFKFTMGLVEPVGGQVLDLIFSCYLGEIGEDQIFSTWEGLSD